jgi:hypothetical protein
VLFGLLTLLAVTLCQRRLSGALAAPPTGALLLGGALLVCLSCAARAAWRFESPRLSQFAAFCLWLAPTGAVVLSAAAMSAPGTSGLGLASLWLLIVAVEGWSLWSSWPRRFRATAAAAPVKSGGAPRRNNSEKRRRFDPAQSRTIKPPTVNPPPIELSDELAPDESLADKRVWQHLTRRHDEATGDVLDGWIRAAFLVGQRTATAHVAFCPPFRVAPRCDVEQVDGPPARIKVAQVLAHGVRFEIKLTPGIEPPCEVRFEFCAYEAADDGPSAHEN